MSKLVPPQFDKYGKTFWIPSQVEPSVALIGAALPALRPLVQDANQWVTATFLSSASSDDKSRQQSVNHLWKRPMLKTPDRPLLQSDTSIKEYVELVENAPAKAV
jgi:hypothetical protein